jgi:hypothetical protein
LKKFLRWILFILGILILTAFISIIWYDYKEKTWYQGPASISRVKQNDTTTVVCILGTVHLPNPNYNSDSIVAILNLFQPDLILTEEDTLLFESYHKRYTQTLQKPFFARLGRSFGFGSAEEIEGRAVRKYKINHPAVDIRPFDYEGRNAFYVANNTFLKEDEVDKKLEHLAVSHLFTQEQLKIWNAYCTLNDSLNRVNKETPYIINQQAYYSLTEKRQDYQYHKVADIVNSHDSLKSLRTFYNTNGEFWNTRNKTMAGHIANFIQRYSKKRILVLTGAMHKYYLRNELTPLQDKLKFRLQEYYE